MELNNFISQKFANLFKNLNLNEKKIISIIT